MSITTKTLLAAMRRSPKIEWETDSTEAGCTVRRAWLGTECERYMVDFASDFKAEGWEQFDTRQDASYYGVWVNRRERVILSFSEGDWGLEECETDEQYNAAIGRLCVFHDPGYVAKIVGANGVTEVCQDRSAFLIGSETQQVTMADVLRAALGNGKEGP